jgi:hypothetical protein
MHRGVRIGVVVLHQCAVAAILGSQQLTAPQTVGPSQLPV